MLMYLLMPSCKLTWVLLVQIQQGKQINKMVQLHDLVQTSTLAHTTLRTNAIHDDWPAENHHNGDFQSGSV